MQSNARLTSLLVNGVHRFATCWQITRTDGEIFRFTDHSRILTVDGNAYTPLATPSASARERKDGTSPSNLEAKSYLDSDAITHADLIAGRYRDALVVEFLIDWKVPWMGKFEQNSYHIIETTFTNEVWVAQLEDGKSRFKQKIGRVYSRNCDYIFCGDRCGLDPATFTQTGSIASVTSLQQFSATMTSQAEDYFTDGVLTWTSGANNGLISEVKGYLHPAVLLHVNTAFAMAPGDTFSIQGGCQHTPEACKAKSNIGNYGGWPTVPGNDRLYSTPDAH